MIPLPSTPCCCTLSTVLASMLTCPAAVVVDGNKTKDLNHVEAGLKGYVSDLSYSALILLQ